MPDCEIPFTGPTPLSGLMGVLSVERSRQYMIGQSPQNHWGARGHSAIWFLSTILVMANNDST